MPGVDLHVHSTVSDGTLTPTQLVTQAVSLGLQALAITDHDTVEGLAEGLAAAEEADLLMIPAVELSASMNGLDMHILGYFIDHTDPTFLSRLAELRKARVARAEQIVDALGKAGYAVSLEDVLYHAEGASVGRSHVARALVGRGHAETVSDAFERFIGRGKPFYVPKPETHPAAVIETIKAVGGVAVLGHPAVTRVSDDVIAELARAGLDGIEAHHGEHTPEQRAHLAALASGLGLIVTGGSDHHGPDAPGVALGGADVPDEVLEALLNAAGRR